MASRASVKVFLTQNRRCLSTPAVFIFHLVRAWSLDPKRSSVFTDLPKRRDRPISYFRESYFSPFVAICQEIARVIFADKDFLLVFYRSALSCETFLQTTGRDYTKLNHPVKGFWQTRFFSGQSHRDASRWSVANCQYTARRLHGCQEILQLCEPYQHERLLSGNLPSTFYVFLSSARHFLYFY